MEISLENREKIIALLKEGTCPICGRKGFGNPLVHINRTHGMSKNEVKDALMISHLCGFAGEKLSQTSRETAKKNRAAGKWYVGQNKGNKGHTKATKEKQAFIQKEIFKQNPNLLLKFKEGSKNANKRQEKPVLRISPNGDIKEYQGVSYAARALGIDASSISKAIRGKNGRTYVAGYKWKYKEGD
jgi:hypothetical protein